MVVNDGAHVVVAGAVLPVTLVALAPIKCPPTDAVRDLPKLLEVHANPSPGLCSVADRRSLARAQQLTGHRIQQSQIRDPTAPRYEYAASALAPVGRSVACPLRDAGVSVR